MKKLILIIVLSLSFQFSFSNERDEILNNARDLTSNKNYKQAIKQYVTYIKKFKNEAVNLKSIYLEIANCYFLNKDNKKAVKVIKETISKYGTTREDLEKSTILDKKLYEVAWADMSLEYTSLRKMYIKSLNNIDLYIEKNSVEETR